MICQHCLRQRLGAWINVETVLCRHMAPLGHNDLSENNQNSQTFCLYTFREPTCHTESIAMTFYLIHGQFIGELQTRCQDVSLSITLKLFATLMAIGHIWTIRRLWISYNIQDDIHHVKPITCTVGEIDILWKINRSTLSYHWYQQISRKFEIILAIFFGLRQNCVISFTLFKC